MKKVLVIENDADTLDIIRFIFEDSEFEVIESTIRLSVEEIIAINPHIIVIDYLLDDCLGSKLCLEVKSNPLTKHIPVILYSASFNLEEIAKDSNADAFISKPFDITEFVETINVWAL
jgi:DNA-binding response OmpR family regulator